MLQTSFACNNYCCTETKPAENLPSSNSVKRIQKNHVTKNVIKNHVTKK